jgi:uncharacterized Tic20 family protein
MNTGASRKLLRSACHGAALASWSLVILGVPIAALLISDDELVRDSAKEAINFSVSMYLWTAICVGLLFTLIGIPAAIAGFIIFGFVQIVFPVIGIVSVCADPNRRFRYPFTIRFLPVESAPVQLTTTELLANK